jgi:hypothetical protein
MVSLATNMDKDAVAFLSFMTGKHVHSSITLSNPKMRLVEGWLSYSLDGRECQEHQHCKQNYTLDNYCRFLNNLYNNNCRILTICLSCIRIM